MMPLPLEVIGYPGLDPAESGKLPNVVYGSVEGVRAHCIVGGATALLTSDITEAQGTVQVEDASRFPSAPFTVQVGYERMLVTDVTAGTLTVTRSYDNTQARAHLKNKTLYEAATEFVYLVAPEPVKSISGVYIDAKKQSEGFTAYTGQSGDEHASFPGKAVVAVNCEGWIGRQRGLDTEAASTREKGQSVQAVVDWASHSEVTDGSDTSFAAISKTGSAMARVAFSGGDGIIRKQTYSATVENTQAGQATLRAIAADSLTGAVSVSRLVHVPASTKLTFTLTEQAEQGGAWSSVFTLLALDEDLKVYAMDKNVLRVKLPEEEDALVSISPAPVNVSDSRVDDGSDSGAGLSQTKRLSAWAAYSSAGPGEAFGQTHGAQVKNTGGASAVVRLVSSEPFGKCYALSRHTLEASAVETLTHTHSGGGWDTMTTLVVETGEVEVRGLYKSVQYVTEDTLGERSLKHTASARAVVGARVTVDLDGAVDTGGSYGGVGTLIERPDHVIEHFLIERMGFSPGDIDTSSFASAGASYASAISGGYRFGFVVEAPVTPSAFLRRLAHECRSVIRYTSSKWQLVFIPDTAPAPVKTITKGELAGQGAMFVFASTPPGELANRIFASYRRKYSARRGESRWEALASAEDAASQSKRGVYSKSVEFASIRAKAMAEDVLALMLLERKDSLLTVRFPVFWEHFDLEVGDTIDIENDLYDGSRFFIEAIERIDRARAKIQARQWW